MKVSKIIVFLCIAAVLGGGFYLFQKDKQKKALIVHNKQKFQQIANVAKKNSSVGLLAMASAINTHHKIKGYYPKKLIHLYPEIIPEKSFISTLNWRYYPKNGTYLIKLNTKGRQEFSSMGPDMKLKTGKDEKISPIGKKSYAVRSKTLKKPPVLISTKTESDLKKDIKKEQITHFFPPKKIKNPDNIKPNESEKSSKLLPKFIIVKKELDNDEKFLTSFDRTNLYIWKNSDGIIGFSNIRYPDAKNLTIYKDKGWIEYHNRQNLNGQK